MPSRTNVQHSGPAKHLGRPAKKGQSGAKSTPAKRAPGEERQQGGPGRLPAPVSSFVGRRLELDRLGKLLAGRRLVTLTGPGGVGKTRLAIKAAQEADEWAGGKWLVQLASLTGSESVLRAVASALGVRQQRGQAIEELLSAHLGDRAALVILDNCEGVIKGAAHAASTLLAGCPGLSIIATSREALGIPGEKVSRLNALAIPPASSVSVLRSLAGYEAVRLFVERARDTEPSFLLTKDVAPAVAEICRRLEGMPLAIELAAARVGALSPAQIADRLDDRFRLLTRGSSTAASRHQSLEAALQWSYDLLSEPEKSLFARLSVFPAGCTLEAAEAVCAEPGATGAHLVDLLTALAAKSLLTFEPAGLYPRYGLLETVRHYASERLAESGDEATTRAAQAAWALALAEQAEPFLMGPEKQSWLQRLDADYGNLIAGLHWAMSNDIELALGMAAPMTAFWRARGYYKEGAELVHKVLDRSAEVRSSARALALSGAASLDVMMGHSEASAPLLEESLELARELDDKRAETRALGGLGFLALNLQGPTAALPLLEEAAELAVEAKDDLSLLGSLAACGRAHMFHGDPSEARRRFEQCLEVAKRVRDRLAVADASYGKGWAALAQGDLDEAQAHLDRALSAAEDWGERYEIAIILTLLGEVARVRSQYQAATDLFGRALELSRPMSANFPLARALVGLGRTAVAQKDFAEAGNFLSEALALTEQARLSSLIPPALHGLAELAEAGEHVSEAKGRYEAALAVARQFEDRASIAGSLYSLARIARSEAGHDQARLLNNEALSMRAKMGDRLGVAASLTTSAGLALDKGEHVVAARILAAAQSIRDRAGLGDTASAGFSPREKADLQAARKSLPANEFKSVWREGSGMDLQEAVSYALRGQGSRGRPASGMASLTPSEKTVAELVHKGLSNAEISERLFISPRTVQAHLSHIFTKLEIGSRRDLRKLWEAQV